MKLKLLHAPQRQHRLEEAGTDAHHRSVTSDDMTDEMIAAVERIGGANWDMFRRDHPARVGRFLASRTLSADNAPSLDDVLRKSRPQDVGADLRRNVDRARQESTAQPFDRNPALGPNNVPVTSTWNEADRQSTKERLEK
jgi:hypothetical protein